VTIVRLTAQDLVEDFHATFSRAFGFFDGYGRNMDAWIDVMGSLTASPPGLSDFRLADGETLTLLIMDAERLRRSDPRQYSELLECSAIVNGRYATKGESGPIAIAMEG